MSEKGDKKTGPGGLKGNRTVLRDNLESIAVAVLLVLLVRQMVVEAFKIPTGSMAPALVGVHREVRCPNCTAVFRVGSDKTGLRGDVICPNCRYEWYGAAGVLVIGHDSEHIVFRRPAWLWHRGRSALSHQNVEGADAANRIDRWGSRIFVNKFVYRLRRPRRWELVVFDYPYGDKNYIKRLIGLPGETVAIRDGNIYINGEIARKPPSVQRLLWMPVHDTARVPDRGVRNWWSFNDGPVGGRIPPGAQEGSLRVDARAAGDPLFARYISPVMDFYAYNGIKNIDGRSGRNRVNEVKISADLTVAEGASGSGAINLRTAGGRHDFRLSIPVGQKTKAALYDGDKMLATAAFPPVVPGRTHNVVMKRYDKQLVATVDGKEVIRYLYDRTGDDGRYEQFIGVGAEGLDVTFKRIRLYRDIYYLPGSSDFGEVDYVLDENSYFVLGDNSPYSSDSREWECHQVPEQNLIGRAFAVFWPVSDIMFLPPGVAEDRE